MHLTKRQKEILDYISVYLDTQGYAPTLEEIGAHFGLSSPATVYKHVQRLVQKGYLRKARHQGRGIELVDSEPERSIELPLRGELRPGRRIEAIRPPRLIAVPAGFRGSAPQYLLRVRGDGVEDLRLLEGDLIVIEERNPGEDGEIVLVVSPDGTPLLGPCRQQPDGLFVRAAPETWQPVDGGGRSSRGVLVAALRRYSAP